MKFRHDKSIVEILLSTELDKAGRWDRDKLDYSRSSKLTIPPSYDTRPLWFNTMIVKLCLQQDSIARVY